MKISTRKFKFMKLNFMAILLMMSISFTALGQTIPTPGTTDYVSFQSGPWTDVTSWRVNGVQPTAAPTSGSNVFINSGHTISITAPNNTTAFNVNCRNLYINTGGALVGGSSGAVAYNSTTGVVSSVTYNVLRVGVNLETNGTESRLINNGTIGSGNNIDATLDVRDMIDIHIYNTYSSGFPANSTFTFSGTGNTKIVGLAAFGAGGTVTKAITLNLNKPILIAGQFSNGARSLTLNRVSGNSTNENYIMNINAAVTVRDNGTSVANNSPATGSTAAAGASFNTSGNIGTTTPGGTYTYNINSTGTLDLSRTTGTQGFIPLPLSGNNNVTTLNVSGTYIMGSGGFTTFNSQSPVSSNYSKVALNILDGGLVDATKITNVNFGANANALTGAYFNISGPNKTGKMKRTLTSGTNDFLFHIGTPNGYSPVNIRNTGTTGDFTVGVVDNFTNFTTFTSPVTSAHTLKNRFTIEASNSASVIGLLKLGWTAVDEGSSFNRTQALALQKYASGTWAADGNVTTSSVTGIGRGLSPQNTTATLTPDPVDPFVVTLTPTTGTTPGTIALTANYTISQDVSVLPLNLLSFTGKLNEFNKQVELKWITTSEVNTKNFEVQESTDGKNFSVVGTVAAKNTSGIHNYSFTVNTNKSGVLYYKLRQIDLDGQFQFSDVIAVEKNGSLLTVYPNPAEDNLTVTIPEGNTAASIAIYALDGKMVYSKSVSANELISNINISTLNTGIYTLVLNKGKESLSQKFIKK
ncbi:hypothetical protein PBAC_08650 [Pedobacter glucosidilyticus]|nr:T9SS type A sorting domain-containing protein [Pedobacter glucosidilyticus]KHJ39000.1 hypothetical protein PBAC_08650 [Pedobacter glucosidilyticus]